MNSNHSTIRLIAPFDEQTAKSLHAGDRVLLSGRILTGRDAAHKRLCDLLDHSQPLPVDLKDQVIYFVGPTPARPGRIIGSAGPTTSSRMDAYSPKLLACGLRGMIGKGYRGENVISALKRYSAVHFSAIGGLGAILAKCIKSSKILVYEDLGAEAIRELIIEDFPLIVAYDCYGNSVYSNSSS
jgi:fumarate hydratase subunit beta